MYKGKILVFDSIPVINAEILINRTKQIVSSDSKGYFSFKGNQNEKIKIKANGFLIKNQKLTGDSDFYKINLRLKNSKKSQQIAINSGHIKNTTQFLSLLVDKKNDIDFSKYNTVIQIIREKFPSIDITNKEIIIRGRSTIYGTNTALIEVDGLPVKISRLNEILPSNIKSIKVLTASNAAKYGSRGGKGVLVIKTKQGM